MGQLNPLAVLDEHVLRMEPLRTQKDLDRLENKYRKIWQRSLRRLINSWTDTDILLDHYPVRWQIEQELRAATRQLARLTKQLGIYRARKELQGFRLAPIKFALAELPDRADETVNRFFSEIPVQARRIVTEALQQGGGIREARAALKVEFPTWGSATMERVARTVSSHHFNVGRFQVFAEAGVEFFTVSAILDSRLCPICYGVDGIVQRFDARLRCYPPLHWSCRCVAVPRVEYEGEYVETEEQLRRAANAKLLLTDFRLGKKRITIWKGIPEGWGYPPSSVPPPIPSLTI